MIDKREIRRRLHGRQLHIYDNGAEGWCAVLTRPAARLNFGKDLAPDRAAAVDYAREQFAYAIGLTR